jgi:protein TonB
MKHIALAFLLFFTTACTAQTDTSKHVYTIGGHPEMPAEFPGGEMALLKFIQANTVYPQAQLDDTLIKHRVIVQFTITEQGKVADIVVKRSAGKLFDAEAIRVISLLPDFKPAEQQGKPISVKYSFPFQFIKQL